MTPRTVTPGTGEPGQRAKALSRKERLHHFDPGGIPDGIFFAHAVARAAMRNGVPAVGSAEAGR